MRGGFVAQSNPELLPLAAPPHRPQPVYVTVPLDHFGPAGGKTMQIHYFLSNSSYKKGGPLFVNMAGEGSVHGCYTSEITAAFDGLSICPEHRFFGETSVPSNDSSNEGLRYLSVEQNLADVKAIVEHVKLNPEYNEAPVVALGGSYSGASAAWVRLQYPNTITASIAESGPVEATLDFFGYDQSNAAALLSPASGGKECVAKVKATTKAIETAYDAGKVAALKKQFNMPSESSPTDFFYMVADSLASAVQYGQKHLVCDNLALLPSNPTDEELIDGWANFTKHSWGPDFAQSCLYDSTCMQKATKG
jgi:hypothetical protein